MSLSMKYLALAFVFALLFAAMPGFVRADDAESEPASDEFEEEVIEEVVEEEPQMYVSPAMDVQTYVKFLGVEGNKFVAGDEVTALIGMTNTGDKTYNVSYVGAHLHSPYDFNFFVQNFTVRWTSNLLPPRSEVTVEYKFKPDASLEPMDFQLSGWLIYNDSTVPTPVIYRSMFVNSTVEVLESRKEWTVQSAFSWVLVLAGLGIAGYVFLNQTAAGKKARKQVTASSSEGKSGGAAAGWDVPVYKPSAVQKAAVKKGPKIADKKK